MRKPVMESAHAVNPERFGRYVLLDRIGEGGMAEVYRAILPGAEGFRRTFVIKKILAKYSQSEKFVEMFVSEARIIALLNHPSIVQVYDFGSVDGQFFLAMEYLRGHDVMAIMRRLRDMKRLFPISVAAFVAHEVAGALAYAHTLTGNDGAPLGIVHRDISPSNVMCLREGRVKLLDFGIASSVNDVGAEKTEQATFKGKLRYMAPERLRNEPFDGRADIYSLGVMLWEMLTCRRLFKGANDAEIWKQVLELPVPMPSALRPDVPPQLDGIVMRMIERDPAKRFETGRYLADDLEEVVREAKFKSRHLPRLLVDLFGSGNHSSQIAMAAISPELLASVAEDNSEVSGAEPDIELVSSAPSLPGRRSSRFWGWLAGGVVLVGLLVAAGLYFVWPPPVPVRSPVVSSPVAPVVPAPAVPIPVKPQPAPSAEVLPPAAEPAPAKAVRAKRPAKSRESLSDNPIAGGRSIDPFAEAAKRGKR